MPWGNTRVLLNWLIFLKTDNKTPVKNIISKKDHSYVNAANSLRHAVELMAKTGEEILPVSDPDQPGKMIGVITYKDILKAYEMDMAINEHAHTKISIKRQRIRMLIKGKKLVDFQ